MMRGAVNGLDLRFFVYAQDQGLVRRVQVQADDIADVVDLDGSSGDGKRRRKIQIQFASRGQAFIRLLP
jgi:hypothetical protein